MVQVALEGTSLDVTIILLLAEPEKYPIMVTAMDKAEEAGTANGITALFILAITERPVFA